MNIQNITALATQLNFLGFGDWSCQLLKRISFRPESFYLVYKTEKNKDRLSFEIFFEKKFQDDMYALVYYDAILQQEIILSDIQVNGVNPVSLEKQMAAIDWKKAFDLEEKKSWNADDKASWEKEQKIEVVMASIEALESTDESKQVAAALKFKYWTGASYYELFGNINVQKSKADISQRFYFFEGQDGIAVDEAYRFLQNRRLEKQMQARKKQADNQTEEATEKSGDNTGSGLLKKRRLSHSTKGRKNKSVIQ
jgi:hypothetical protein